MALHEAPPPDLDGIDAAIVYGAEAQVDQDDELDWIRSEKRALADLVERHSRARHLLRLAGVAQFAGAEVRLAAEPEIGWYETELTPKVAPIRCSASCPSASRRSTGTTTSGCSPGAVAPARSAPPPSVPAPGPAGLGLNSTPR